MFGTRAFADPPSPGSSAFARAPVLSWAYTVVSAETPWNLYTNADRFARKR
jgi:hypothetical protein